MNIWGFGMVFPAGTLCTHARVSGQVEMTEKCCFGSLSSIFLLFFLRTWVVLALLFWHVLVTFISLFFFCWGLWCQAWTVRGAASFCALWHPAGAVLLGGDARPWDRDRNRDSSVGGTATCLAPRALLLSPPDFCSLGLVLVPGL